MKRQQQYIGRNMYIIIHTYIHIAPERKEKKRSRCRKKKKERLQMGELRGEQKKHQVKRERKGRYSPYCCRDCVQGLLHASATKPPTYYREPLSVRGGGCEDQNGAFNTHTHFFFLFFLKENFSFSFLSVNQDWNVFSRWHIRFFFFSWCFSTCVCTRGYIYTC